MAYGFNDDRSKFELDKTNIRFFYRNLTLRPIGVAENETFIVLPHAIRAVRGEVEIINTESYFFVTGLVSFSSQATTYLTNISPAILRKNGKTFLEVNGFIANPSDTEVNIYGPFVAFGLIKEDE